MPKTTAHSPATKPVRPLATAPKPPTTVRTTPGTTWWMCTPPVLTLPKGPLPARMSRVTTRVIRKVSTNAVRARSSGSLPGSTMLRCSQWPMDPVSGRRGWAARRPRRPGYPADVSMTPPPLDGLRFAFGTLSVLPVKVTRWDREAARGGMLCAPLVGVALGCMSAALGLLLLALGSSALLAAVATVAVSAVLTRGLHLDGLADTADGLGSGKPAEDALRIMKQSDIGPFGVLTLVLVLLGQVAALAGAYETSWTRGAAGFAVASVAARTAMTLACRQGVAP